MTTAKDVFDIAIGLMASDTNGATDTADTMEYKNRTLFILNALMGELYPYSDTFQEAQDGKRPVVEPIWDFEAQLPLDDFLAQTVLPYGLAAHLLLEESPERASFFQQRYEELIQKLGHPPRNFERISDVYNVLSGMRC